MNLLLHGVEDFKIAREDTLCDPVFYSCNRLAHFNCVVANPPFSLKAWGDIEWASDKWGRNQLGGVPPKGYADWAWVQHMLTSADPRDGRVAVVLPQGALFRQGAEARIRAHVLKAKKIEAVIGLAPNLFYGTGLAACVLILRHGRPADQQDSVLFINGEDLMRKGRNQNALEPEHAAELLEAYQEYANREGRSRVVSLSEIEGNSFNLNIPLYVAPADKGETATLAEAFARLETAQARAANSRTALEAELERWGLSA